MQEVYVNVDQLTPELKEILDSNDQLDLVVELDDEDLNDLNFQTELDDEGI